MVSYDAKAITIESIITTAYHTNSQRFVSSGELGPINTWSRTAYIQPPSPNIDSDTRAHKDRPEKTLIQEWTNIDNNFVMVGPKFGALYGPGNGTCSNGMWQRDCPKGGGSMFTCLVSSVTLVEPRLHTR